MITPMNDSGKQKLRKIYCFVSGIHFHLIGMQICIECPRILKDEMVHKGWNIYILFQDVVNISEW